VDTFADVEAAATQIGANTWIDLGAVVITLVGVDKGDLTAGDFLVRLGVVAVRPRKAQRASLSSSRRPVAATRSASRSNRNGPGAHNTPTMPAATASKSAIFVGPRRRLQDNARTPARASRLPKACVLG